MITINYESIDLRVVQQDNEICESVKQMRGTIHVDGMGGVASFVEDAKRVSSQKNPLFWAGKHMKLRIDKAGYLRGTFRVRIPDDDQKLRSLIGNLDGDFESVINCLDELSNAQQPKNKRKRIRVA